MTRLTAVFLYIRFAGPLIFKFPNQFLAETGQGQKADLFHSEAWHHLTFTVIQKMFVLSMWKLVFSLQLSGLSEECTSNLGIANITAPKC